MTRRTAAPGFIAPLAAAMVSVLVACAVPGVPEPTPGPPPAKTYLEIDLTTFDRVPGWKGDDHSQALPALLKSCEKLKALPPDRALGAKPEFGRVADWTPICAAAALIRPGNRTEALYFFESRFRPYRARNAAKTTGLFTGYYEPELRGAWKPDTVFRHPIYARPKDLVSVDLGRFRAEWRGEHIAGRVDGNEFVPYATRADIHQGVLKGRQLELLWVDSAIDAFFLHVQGSGRVVFADGSSVRVGYAGRNGHRYTPIGRELVAMGAIPADRVSLGTIREWLAANPLAGTEIMERNKSFIFFRIVDEDGPVGAQGAVLTPGRSLAVDDAFIPLGVPIWLVTTEPGPSRKPLRRLVVAQDTGSGVKGPVRGDLFFGFGNDAGVRAGRMRESGSYYLLLPKLESPGS